LNNAFQPPAAPVPAVDVDVVVVATWTSDVVVVVVVVATWTSDVVVVAGAHVTESIPATTPTFPVFQGIGSTSSCAP
jgi:hypothetical protein